MKTMPVAAAGIVGGVILAVVYVLSPMTVWLAVAMVPLFVAAGWGLPREERRWVWTLLACALAIRVLMLAGLLLSTDQELGNFQSFFFDDDGRASKLRATWMRNAWLELPIEPFEYHAFARDYGWTSYLNVIAYLQYLLGPAPYGIHLLNVWFFLVAAVLLYRVARRAYGRLAALVGFGFLLFSPGLVLWSSSAMKESLQSLLIVATAVAVIEAVRRGAWSRRAAAAAAGMVVFAALLTVKREIAVVTFITVLGGVAGAFVVRRRNLLIAAPLLAAIVAWSAWQYDPIQERLLAGRARAVAFHMGHVHTTGHGYKLLDARHYFIREFDNWLTPAETARFATRAAVSFVLVPLPWQSMSRPELLFIPAQMFWYCLLALAAWGLVTALRRDALVTMVLLTGTVLFGGARAVSEGNIGTLVRHRDIIVPLFVWFSGVGAAMGLQWVTRVGTPGRADSAARDAGANAAAPLRGRYRQGSRVCRWWRALLTPLTPGVDRGFSVADETRVLERLAMLAHDSWLAGLLVRARLSWSNAAVVRVANRLFGHWSTAQRFQAAGFAIAWAVAIEAAFMSAEGLGVSMVGVAVRVLLVAVAALFITMGAPAGAAWRQSRFRTMGVSHAQ